MLKWIKDKLGSRMGHDVVWTFSMQLLIMICSFAINKLLANRLSMDDFGQYNVIKRSVQVLSFIMLAGVGITLPRYIPLFRNSNPPQRIAPLMSVASIYIIGVSLVVFFFCICFYPLVGDIIIGESNNLKLLIVALTYAFILTVSQYVFAYYRGIGDFKWYNGTQLAMQLLIVTPLIALPLLSVERVFIAWLLISILIVICLISRELRGKRLSLTLQSSLFKTLIKYSAGRLIADFFQYSLAAFPLIYISNIQGLKTTAYFSVGIFFVTMVTPIFSFMGIILLPYVSKVLARNKMAIANRLVNHLAIIYIGASLLFISFIYIFTEPLTSLLFSSDYIETKHQTRIMILSILPQALYMLYRNTIDAVSVIPYNAIFLGGCLGGMIIGFMLSSTLTHYAWAYLAVSTLQGILAWGVWTILCRNIKNNYTTTH